MDKDDLVIRLGEKIKKLRKARHMSQEELASRIGKSVDTISNIERGIFPPRLETAQALATVFDLSLSELFRFEDIGGVEKEKRELLEKVIVVLRDQPIELLAFTLAHTRQLVQLKESFINKLNV